MDLCFVNVMLVPVEAGGRTRRNLLRSITITGYVICGCALSKQYLLFSTLLMIPQRNLVENIDKTAVLYRKNGSETTVVVYEYRSENLNA